MQGIWSCQQPPRMRQQTCFALLCRLPRSDALSCKTRCIEPKQCSGARSTVLCSRVIPCLMTTQSSCGGHASRAVSPAARPSAAHCDRFEGLFRKCLVSAAAACSVQCGPWALPYCLILSVPAAAQKLLGLSDIGHFEAQAKIWCALQNSPSCSMASTR